ncbi:MAG: polyprenyl synthetase family protein [Actinomycetota bacterium]|nr:polyprenyl synthetase family protein [Actinomycetota bacterium]
MNIVEQLGLPRIDEQLTRVEVALKRSVSTEDRFLSQVAGHLAAAGGKRVRPAMALAASAAAGGSLDDDVVEGAVSVELVHLGSLYHDDVMDEAEQRRGVPSVNARWGNLVAVLVGDLLMARASEIAAALGADIAALLASTIVDLCAGEVAQLEYSFDTSRSEDAYFRAISGKTASLTACATRLGAMVGGASKADIDALTGYGRAFGMTFQVWDDILDLVGTETRLGKPAGHDMVEGTYTLPVIRALATPEVGDELRALLGGALDPPARDKAKDLIVGSDAIAASVAEARRWADRAAGALEPLRGRGRDEAIDTMAAAGHKLIDDLDLA